MSPMPIASVTLAPHPFELRPEGRLAATGPPATSTRSTLEPAQIDVPFRRPLDQMGRIGRREHDGRAARLDRPQQSPRVAGADRNVAQADPVEGGQRSARHEWPRVVGADDALAGGDAGGCSCADAVTQFSRSPAVNGM